MCGPSYHMLSDPNELVLISLYICPSPRCNYLLIRQKVVFKKTFFSLSLSLFLFVTLFLTSHYGDQCFGNKCVLKFATENTEYFLQQGIISLPTYSDNLSFHLFPNHVSISLCVRLFLTDK